jgi:hypothetical protein
MTLQPTKRRLFITENSQDFYKLFTVGQGSQEADIYFTWPQSKDTHFSLFDPTKSPGEFKTLVAAEAGKLSFHASGQVHFAEDGMRARDEFVIKGNQLFNVTKSEIGMRHLFTGFISQPVDKAPDSSPAFNRKSDDSFLTKNLAPAIIMFFAVPNGFSIELEMKLNTDHFKVPEHLPGIGTFPMKHHCVFWIAYQQIHLAWPKHNHIAYSDGYYVPLFIGKENNAMELIMVVPQYEVTGQKLKMKIHQVNE